jgi:hypothetical protein
MSVLSPREMEVLALAWQCMDAPPKVRILPPSTHPNPTDPSPHRSTCKSSPSSPATPPAPPPSPLAPSSANSKPSATPPAPRPPSTPSRSGAKRAAKPAADDTPSKRAKKPAPPHKAKHLSAQDAADDDDDDELFAPAIKKEEVLELNVGANLYFDHLQSAAAGYDPRARENDVD